MANLFRYFNSSPEVIRLVVIMFVRFPRSLRKVEDLLQEWDRHHPDKYLYETLGIVTSSK